MEQTLQIFKSVSGHPSLKVIFENGNTKHIHSSVAPEKEYEFFQDIKITKRNILFLGFGAGYHILDKLESISKSSNIVIVDLFDELSENAKVNIFKGYNVSTINRNSSNHEISEILSSLNNYQIIKHPASYNINPVFYDKILSYLQLKRVNKSISKKKIMLLQGSFFLESEIQNAIQNSNSLDFLQFPYNKYKSSYEFENILLETIQKENIDLIISVNCKGFDGEGYLSKISSTLDIPIALWFVDDPHPILLNQKQYINDNIYAFCWEKSYLPYLEKLNFKGVQYLPLACDPSLFKIRSENNFTVDIGFIGSSMGNNFLNDIRRKFIWQSSFQSLSEAVAQKLLQSHTSNLWNLIQKNAEELQIEIPFSDERNKTWLCSYIIHTASMLSRRSIIKSLKNMPLEIFGDPEGWYELVGNQFKLHPNIDYRTGLCKAYQNIAVNINITSKQMASAVNQRVFDAPMSGSFIISDNQADMHHLFEIEKEAIIYKNIEDLKEKISFYLSAPEKRREISQNARKRILNDHTYAHRLTKIINTIFD